MKLGQGGSDSDGRQNTIVLVAAIVVILIAGFLLARNFMGGKAPDAPPPGEFAGRYGAMPGPPGSMPPGGPMPPGMPPGHAGPGAAPGAAPNQPSPSASATYPARPSTPATTAPAPPPRAGSPAPKPNSTPQDKRTYTVFGNVKVTYPKGWGIAQKGSGTVAVFTNRKASFEVHPPDPKARTAKAIAEAALKKQGKGAKILAQGEDKVGNYNAYWYAVSLGGKTMRIVGIDGPTRIAILARVKTGDFARYRETFDKMQAGITFGR